MILCPNRCVSISCTTAWYIACLFWYIACLLPSVRKTSVKKLVVLTFLIGSLIVGHTARVWAAESICPGGANPDPAVIWCDDFDDGVALGARYYDYDNADGRFVKIAGTGLNGSTGLQATYQAGVESAGHFIFTFGRNPADSRTQSTVTFRNIYYRIYVRAQPGWTVTPTEGVSKFSRLTSFVDSSRSQAMIAHVWSGSTNNLEIDPASCVVAGVVQCVGYNDFAHLVFLGRQEGTTTLFSAADADKWFCVESHVKLNDPGQSNGVQEFWVNGKLEASRSGLNFTDTYADYALNALFIENFWNNGAPATQSRYFDNLIVSTARIGCINLEPPSSPTALRLQ
jgi:hypothetical protein